jgi:acyl-CoA reductase-like NAD-dependent aldehyde dehydrogenase
VFSQVKVADPFDAVSQMGPLATTRQRDRVEGYIAMGIAAGAAVRSFGGLDVLFNNAALLEEIIATGDR